MSTILIKDSLRQSVEAASNGEQTVLYTAKGQATFMNIIKKFDLSTIDPSLSGTHPAFTVNGVEKDAIYVGTYQGCVKNGELLSLPNVAPTYNLNYDTLLANARACGNGHHLITNAEWSAIALQCNKNKTIPSGNTYFGRSAEDSSLTGRRVDGVTPGTQTEAAGVTLTGSGPVSWRHNLKYNGISDMSGNISEWCSGLRIVDGEIQIIENNNAAQNTISLSADSTEWKAIHAETGALIATGSVNSVKFATSGAADYSLVAANNSLFSGVTNPSATKPVLAPALLKLKALCIIPISAGLDLGGDGIYLNIASERLLLRGGRWQDSIWAGINQLNLFNLRTVVGHGSRPAYYTP